MIAVWIVLLLAVVILFLLLLVVVVLVVMILVVVLVLLNIALTSISKMLPTTFKTRRHSTTTIRHPRGPPLSKVYQEQPQHKRSMTGKKANTTGDNLANTLAFEAAGEGGSGQLSSATQRDLEAPEDLMSGNVDQVTLQQLLLGVLSAAQAKAQKAPARDPQTAPSKPRDCPPDVVIVKDINSMPSAREKFTAIRTDVQANDAPKLTASHMAITLPRSKTGQEGKGQTARIARVGGVACLVDLTDRLLWSGNSTLVPSFPAEGVCPLLCRVKCPSFTSGRLGPVGDLVIVQPTRNARRISVQRSLHGQSTSFVAR
ncbi:hypothetical protein VOLCADRAFT_94256 [Volvox carteri f. nagariensis]|uniref:Uncharacterized protein n=1 Tax=Volvox carteri f. nagariensis TaxID=3068 RepID=D8U411_VOLCA|nr:uncharacterized protein VOLCADRAFT_94256 [Volvox carteri f. nagariensis]EFJ45515.1 hypothetical protein VOLCADRAFT_94256 [Volvox carteri f. nagariensis]|eukprot:XP_002953542.1 hypothetical protein VOLCADRAFT_94256 [Volvox carteri f. nagariensis]